MTQNRSFTRAHNPPYPLYARERATGLLADARENEKPTAYTLTLRAEGDGPPVAIRLRKALKVLLRSFGLRCTGVEQIGTAQACEGTPLTITSPEPPARETGGDCEPNQ
jgi:hypothetical protein